MQREDGVRVIRLLRNRCLQTGEDEQMTPGGFAFLIALPISVAAIAAWLNQVSLVKTSEAFSLLHSVSLRCRAACLIVSHPLSAVARDSLVE